MNLEDFEGMAQSNSGGIKGEELVPLKFRRSFETQNIRAQLGKLENPMNYDEYTPQLC